MNPISETFAGRTSPVHRLDPRVKIVAGTVFSFLVALSDRPGALMLSAAAAVGLLLAARPPLREVLKRIAVVNGFIVFLWLVLPWTVPGRSLATAGPLHATVEGVRLAALITWKCNTILAAFLALLATESPFTLFHALAHLRVPEKIVQLFFFCGRYVELFMNEVRRLRTAMKMRGFRPRTDLHTYRSYAYLVGMLLVRSVDRSERIHQAMRCRGFTGTFPTFVDFRIRRSDGVFALCFACFLTGLVVMECTPWLP